MKPMSLNLKDAKKISGDKHSSTFHLPSGHKILIAHSGVSAAQRKQLEQMPVQYFADGTVDGPVSSSVDDTQDSAPPVTSDDSPASQTADPSIANDIGQGLRTVAQNSLIPAVAAGKAMLGQAGSFIKGLGGQSDADNTDASDLPSADPNLPGAGQPVGQPQSDRSTASTQAPASGVQPSGGLSPQSILSTGLAGIKGQAEAAGNLGQQQADIEKQQQQSMADAQGKWALQSNDMQNDISNAVKDIQAGHIQPNHYLQNMSVPGHIATAIGLILGGAGAGAGRPNPAMEFLQSQINRDVDSQKSNLQNKATVLGAYMDKYKNAATAENMARATSMGAYASKLRQAADNAASPMQRAAAQSAAAQLENQMLPIIQHAGALQTLQQRQQQKAQNPSAGGPGPVDLPAMSLMQKTGIMPQQDVEAANKEAGSLQETAAIKNMYNQAFAALRGKAMAGSLTPGDRAGYINGLSGMIQKSFEGRFNMEAADRLVDGMLPSKFDLNSTDNDKLKMGNELLDSKSAATPTLDRYGLKNQPAQQPSQPQHKVGDIIYLKGQKNQIIDAKGNLRRVA
jgi:hypothetical protein